MVEAIEQLQTEANEALAQASDAAALEAWRVDFLGTKGRLKAMMASMRDLSKEERPAFGQRMNAVKESLEVAFESRRSQMDSASPSLPPMDLTEPGMPGRLGQRHVLTRTIDEIVEVFARMGFSVAEGPEVEDEWHNFNALNIPEDHPARDSSENFFLGAGRMLRSQTSTVQIRVMEQSPPPLKIMTCGRVYRPDTHDATHYSMFHQVEGLCIDRGVTMIDLKSALFQFARAYFGPEAEVRMRPSFFPFTEPSAEVDMKMKIKGRWQWVELGGCGMVDPNVLKAVDIDPEEWTGYAFGLGIERIAMRRYGISDIRWLYENDERFLRQF
ncbi:MAG: phenylalanine--tRNA ligase subunit alpha [Phycisphaerales bacterium]|nr:phenylalanine--tRNA ligase subunit alpha [Phycisphaerales bacterium]